MKVFRAAMLLTLTALIGVSSGCARWTLLPKSAPPIPQQGEAPRQRTSLLEAAGLKRGGDNEQANGVAQQQQMSNDLAHLDPALAMARLAERQGSADEARRQYRQYIEKNPNHPLPHHRLGVMAAREAKFDQAEVHFQTAARLGRPSAELLSDMGYMYYLQDRLGEAETMLRQATQMEPANTNANNNLGLVLAARGNFDNSLRQFRTVNGEAEARANLAYTHSQRGDLDKAREEYLRALTLDKSLSTAAEALIQIEEARQREHAALAKMAEAAGDELISSQAPNAQQYPASMQGQNAHPAAYGQAATQAAMQVAQAQPSYTQPQQQTAPAYQSVRQPAAPNTNAVATNKFEQQAQFLMPIPAPPEESKANYPSGNVAYPETGVERASYAQPANHVEATSRFTDPQLAVESAVHAAPESAQPTVRAEAPSAPTSAGEQWEDAWHQFTAPAVRGDTQPKTSINVSDDASQPSGGVRISIGG